MLPTSVDPLLSDRILRVSTGTFLAELAAGLAGGRPLRGRGGSVAQLVRVPLFVHHRRPVAGTAAVLASQLLADAEGLAGRATDSALERARDVLAAGRFRRPAEPGVAVRGATQAALAVLDLTWTSDEEATGWPSLTLGFVLEAHRHGSRLVVVSDREPGYDLSRNRVDKHQRDRLLRNVGPWVAEAICDHIRVDHSEAPVPAAPPDSTLGGAQAQLVTRAGR